MPHIIPTPQRWLDPEHREYRPGLSSFAPGGKYLDVAGNDLTEQTVGHATISVMDGGPSFRFQGLTRADTGYGGRVARVNLIRRQAGWKWLGEPCDAYRDLGALVSLEWGGRHHYALEVRFERVRLARYPRSASEPRLRPTAYATGLDIEYPEVAWVSLRGRRHPVAQAITVLE